VKLRVLTPLVVFVLFAMAVGLACSMPSSEETPAAPVQADTAVPAQADTTAPQSQPETAAPKQETSGAVSNLQDVQNAVIQIEAQGAFVDPQFGAYTGAGRGSGFIIDPSGIAVTNNHVVTGAALLKVWIGGDTGKTYNARILGVSECSDLAVIQIEGGPFPYLEWYSQPIKVGLDVYTAGFPLGEPEYALTKGIISKEHADGETDWASVDSVLMHDATINPGNSGGPLVDSNGKVVGVNYAAYKSADQYFAIAPDVAIPIVEQLRAGKDVDSIGVNGMAVISEDGSLSGIWVNSVQAGSPAERAGITGGDVIMKMADLPMATDGTMADYCDVIRTHPEDETINVEVLRFDTSEYLAGQLNGDKLAVVQTFDAEDDMADTGDSGDTSGYYTVYDDTGAITVDVPNAWTEQDTGIWENSWGNSNFTAASIIATTDFSDYNNWAAPGVWFAASEDWGKTGGYIQLLDGVKGWYEDDCDFESRSDYEDVVFEGGFDIWTNCGSANSMNVVIAARPKNDPLAYLVLVQVQVLEDADLDALDVIIDSFDRVGDLP